MPLIQIDLDRELFDSLGDKLSDAVHQAQLDALGIPSDDLFQVFTPHGPGELRFDSGYNGVDRQRLVLLRITMVHMYPVRRSSACTAPSSSGSPMPAYAPRTS